MRETSAIRKVEKKMWTIEKTKEMARYVSEGKSQREIAVLLGSGFTRNSVKNKISRMKESEVDELHGEVPKYDDTWEIMKKKMGEMDFISAQNMDLSRMSGMSVDFFKIKMKNFLNIVDMESEYFSLIMRDIVHGVHEGKIFKSQKEMIDVGLFLLANDILGEEKTKKDMIGKINVSYENFKSTSIGRKMYGRVKSFMSNEKNVNSLMLALFLWTMRDLEFMKVNKNRERIFYKVRREDFDLMMREKLDFMDEAISQSAWTAGKNKKNGEDVISSYEKMRDCVKSDFFERLGKTIFVVDSVEMKNLEVFKGKRTGILVELSYECIEPIFYNFEKENGNVLLKIGKNFISPKNVDIKDWLYMSCKMDEDILRMKNDLEIWYEYKGNILVRKANGVGGRMSFEKKENKDRKTSRTIFLKKYGYDPLPAQGEEVKILSVSMML